MPPSNPVALDISLSTLIPSEPKEVIDDSTFRCIAGRLKDHPDLKSWKDNPRTYALLRMAGCDPDSTAFRTCLADVRDIMIPFEEGGFSSLIDDGELTKRMVELMPFVLSRPETLGSREFQKLVAPVHRHIWDGNDLFEELELLGAGGSCEVNRIRHKDTGQLYARKKIHRGVRLSEQCAKLVEFEQEISTLKKLKHVHLVQYVCSYTDFDTFALILSPVADHDLKAMLSNAKRKPLSPVDARSLRKYFGCLAEAVRFLHCNRIRHKDIKPANVLIRDEQVFLCDFGISRDSSMPDAETITQGAVGKYTSMYCSPEVAGFAPRNASSDLFSLGCVFLEMVTVLKGRQLEDLTVFMDSHGRCSTWFWGNLEAAMQWLDQLKEDSFDDAPLVWIKAMMQEKSDNRITATDLVENIKRDSLGLLSITYIGPCCGGLDHYVTKSFPEGSFSPDLSPRQVSTRTSIVDKCFVLLMAL